MQATRERAARVACAYEYCEWKREMAEDKRRDSDRDSDSCDAGRIANAFSIDSNRK